MKILFSLTYYTPYVSGLTLYVKRLAEALLKKGFQPSVICFQHDRKLPLEENINGVKVIRVRPLFKLSKGFISFDWLVKSLLEVRSNDVLVISLPQAEGIIPALFAKVFQKKIITIYHCEVVLPPGIFNKTVEWVLNLSNRITLFLSDKIITYTEDFAEHSRILSYFSKKTKYIYPPVPVPNINKRVRNIIMRKIGVKPKFIIGVAARLAAEKGIEYLLETIPLIQNVIARSEERTTRQSRAGSPRSLRSLAMTFKIVIAGSLNPVGEESYKKKILKLVQKYKEYIVFLGELKEEEMGSFYSLLDVLVLPSINSTESFGMVQVEAMMMGIPVVVSDLPGVRVPVQKTGMGVIVPIQNSHKLAEAIAEVLNNKKKYIKNKNLIKKEFSLEKTIEFYIKLL